MYHLALFDPVWGRQPGQSRRMGPAVMNRWWPYGRWWRPLAEETLVFSFAGATEFAAYADRLAAFSIYADAARAVRTFYTATVYQKPIPRRGTLAALAGRGDAYAGMCYRLATHEFAPVGVAMDPVLVFAGTGPVADLMATLSTFVLHTPAWLALHAPHLADAAALAEVLSP